MNKFASKMRAGIAATATILGLGVALFVAPSPALAVPVSENNYAVAASRPSDRSQDMIVAGSTAYFVDGGDTWYVQDTAADGRSAIVQWENYINFEWTRRGICINSLGNGAWGSCSKNYLETSGIRARACTVNLSTGFNGPCSEWKTVKGEIIP